MKLRNLGYAAFIVTAAAGLVIGSAGPSEAAKKKKAEAAAPATFFCFPGSAPVCAAKGGSKFTYANSCYATNDGAKVASQGACKLAKAKKKSMAKAKPATKKPAMKKPAAKKNKKKA